MVSNSKGKHKAPKKSKKQLEEERLRLEEEKRIQEEIERKQREEEQRKRAEEERIRRQEEAKRAAEERARLAQEVKDVERFYGGIKDRYAAVMKQLQMENEWLKFLKCDMLPDPYYEKEITTHLTLWREKKELTLQECALNCQEAENVRERMIQITSEIMKILSEAQSEFNNERIMWCINYINQLRKMARHKIDELTAFIFQHIEDEIEKQKIQREKLQAKATGMLQKESAKPPYDLLHLQESKDFRMGIWACISPKAYRVKPISFESLGIEVQLPRVGLHPLCMRAVWTSYNDLSGDQFSPDLIVGGVFDIEVYKYPPEMKVSKHWLMTQVYDIEHTLDKIPYPDPTANAQAAGILKIYLTMPSYFFLQDSDDLKVGRWDPKEKTWVTDGIEEPKYDRQSRKLLFTTIHLQPFAVLQDRCYDFPYQSWKLRCVDEQTALLDIVGKRLKLVFEIGAGYCKLIERDEPELQHVVGQKLVPGVLLHELSRCGIHLLPIDQDCKRVGRTAKEDATEERAITDIATSVRAFAFRSSKWNKDIDGERVLVKIRENLEFDRQFHEDEENDWTYVMWYPNKVTFSRYSDEEEKCDDRPKQGHETHSLLNMCLNGNCSPEAYERLFEFGYILFIQTLKKFLRLLRILSFT